MRKFAFSPETLDLIAEQRLRHAHPHIQRKLEVLWLKSKKVPHREIARRTELGRRTIQRDLTESLTGGLTQTMELRFKSPPSQ
jgi:hypothetical protein